MNNILLFILFPIIGGFIGWITNKLAIWFLFNPKKPIYILKFKFQGVFPKRQSIIAERFSSMVVDELLTPEMIQKHIFSSDNVEKLFVLIEDKINQFLEKNLKEEYPILSFFISQSKKNKIKTELFTQISDQIHQINHNFKDDLAKYVDLKQIIHDKIISLDTDDINLMMKKILKDEFKFIEIMGGILGFVIGLLQIIILKLIT